MLLLVHMSLQLLQATARHNSRSSQANVRSSTPPLPGSKNRSNRSSVDNSPLTNAKLVHERKRNSQLSVKSNTNTVTTQVEKQQQQKSNLVSHNQNAPQPVRQPSIKLNEQLIDIFPNRTI